MDGLFHLLFLSLFTKFYADLLLICDAALIASACAAFMNTHSAGGDLLCLHFICTYVKSQRGANLASGVFSAL